MTTLYGIMQYLGECQETQERSQEILNVPDFDTSNKIKMKNNEPSLIKKLLSDIPDYVELRKELFPMQQNLKDLCDAKSATH